ncbi:rod-determining factor RdfA, partial [Halorhabdus amylolytica]|uniref:rod-determining factor RdfA n=1 Tax=Halorhabdus amylolytica TaxID=2559573 RepID=UPI0031F4AB10
MADGDRCSCKVGRVATQYDLVNLDEELRRRYGAEASLRDLETFVNEGVLRAAIERVGGDVATLASSDRGVEALYEVLQEDEGTSPAER